MTTAIRAVPNSKVVPYPGTPLGNQVRAAFIANLLGILGDTRLLWLPATGETTTSTDRSRYAATLTYSKSVATWDAPPSVLGSGMYNTFDGTDEEADTPDAASLSFGDGTLDEPFSIVALVQQNATATNKTILSKRDITTGSTKSEWNWYFNSDEKLAIQLFDESAAAYIGRYYNTALATGTWLFVAVTNDGTGVAGGLKLYSAAAQIDDTSFAPSGSYVAMENTASLVRLGFTQGAAAGTEFMNGSMALVALTGGALSIAELWAVKSLVNSFYGLSL